MIINGEMSKEMYNELNGTKQISKLSFEEKDLLNWCHTRNKIIELGYKKRMLNDDELEDFLVPTALKDIFIPRKISYAKGEDFVDFRGDSYKEYSDNLSKHGMDKAEVLDAVKFNRISKGIAGSRKTDLKSTSVDTLVGEALADAYVDRLNDLSDGKTAKVKPGTKHYVPIDFKHNYMESEFYTQKASKMFSKWFASALDDLKNSQA